MVFKGSEWAKENAKLPVGSWRFQLVKLVYLSHSNIAIHLDLVNKKWTFVSI